jgi:hypothetical protein
VPRGRPAVCGPGRRHAAVVAPRVSVCKRGYPPGGFAFDPAREREGKAAVGAAAAMAFWFAAQPGHVSAARHACRPSTS